MRSAHSAQPLFASKSTDCHANYGLIVSSIPAQSCYGAEHGFPFKHKTFFHLMTQNNSARLSSAWKTQIGSLTISTVVLADSLKIVSCILKDDNPKFTQMETYTSKYAQTTVSARLAG